MEQSVLQYLNWLQVSLWLQFNISIFFQKELHTASILKSQMSTTLLETTSAFLFVPFEETAASKEDYTLPCIFPDYVCFDPALEFSLVYTWRGQLEHFRYRCETLQS